MKGTLPLRRERAEHANALLKVIAAHGRRFFWNETHDRVSHFEVDDRSRVWYVDHYTGTRIYTHRSGFGNNWRGFTNGGTLRDLVEWMADYIVSGYKVPRYKLGGSTVPPHGNIEGHWAYPAAELRAMRAEAFKLPIVDGDHTEF